MNLIKSLVQMVHWRWKGHRILADLVLKTMLHDDYVCEYIETIHEVTRQYTGSKVVAETMAAVAGVLYVVSKICDREDERAELLALLMKGTVLGKTIREVARRAQTMYSEYLHEHEECSEPVSSYTVM